MIWKKKTSDIRTDKTGKRFAGQDRSERNSKNICDGMSFTAAESYKMLRTKIDMILPAPIILEAEDEEKASRKRSGKIIGVTSALRGEGKSTTAINLAYTFAEAGRKVCLLEADMRLPNIGKRLSLKRKPGLSNLLTGQATGGECIQTYQSEHNVTLYVITAGDCPPMPSELLQSENMEYVLALIKETFDCIIVDLPPVMVVTDALATAKNMDGVLFVVRQDYCDKASLLNAVNQFELSGTKTLGVVLNCSKSGTRTVPYYRQRKST